MPTVLSLEPFFLEHKTLMKKWQLMLRLCKNAQSLSFAMELRDENQISYDLANEYITIVAKAQIEGSTGSKK